MQPRRPGPPRSSALLRALLPGLLVASLLATAPASWGDDLGSARLLIAGTDLTVSPESQTVPFNTPTVVETHLQGFDPGQGTLPADLRVLADFIGPEIDGILVLETRPNQPFRIPRLSLKGEYVLDNIRLVQGEDLLAYAQPRSAAVLVTQVLVTRVTSRALTLDEIRHYGIVVDDDNFRAFNFTFGFAVDGEVYDYNIPVVTSSTFGEEYRLLLEGTPDFGGGRSGTGSPRFRPPQMAPFTLDLETSDGARPDTASGGCANPFGCMDDGAPVSLPGVLLFPTDVSLLNQYFSVVLMAKNDAPAGDALVIRDLTAKVTLPAGLRMAQTEPPTPLGVPVPVRVPGADGRLGTADDLTFLIAQASGEAEVLVEGRKEGTHVVTFDLEGVLEGMPGGRIARVSGRARGAVVVRDPSLGVTISHPAVVRAAEEYDLRLTVANTSNAPVNLVTVALPASKLSGVQVVGAHEKTIPSLLPGESEIVAFRLLPGRTGKVVATSVRSPSQVAPRFELAVGVGEGGIPLSPDSIVLPESTEQLPEGIVSSSLALVGLGFSLATAPAAGLDSNLPRMDLSQVDEKVYWLSQAGRHVGLGEETFDAVAVLAAEWTGARPLPDWEWDRLRRTTQKGGQVGGAFAGVFAAEAATTSPAAALRRFASTTSFLGPLQAALATGDGVRLEISSRTSGLRLGAGGLDPSRRRELPFADLYDLDGAELALLAQPEEGGYQARLTDADGGGSSLRLVLPDGTGGLREVSWTGVGIGAAGLAVVDFTPHDPLLTLYVDADGDGLVDEQLPGTESSLAPRPFVALAAVQRADFAGGHVIDVLFSQDVDLSSLLPLDPQRFSLPGNASNGGMVPTEADLAAFNWVIAENKFSGLRNTRVVQVVFSNPVSPYGEHTLTVRDVEAASGAAVAQDSLPLVTTLTIPGAVVEGRVIGGDGQPIPFARVDLFEADLRWQTGDCIRHRTASTRTDAQGAFRFDYVRAGTCGDVFRLRSVDPQTGRGGEATGRVRFAGGTQNLDVVLLGRGTIRGRVTYDDGSVPQELRVVAHSPVFAEGIQATVYADGRYEAEEVPVGTLTLGAGDRQGSFVYQTLEVPRAGAVVERDLVILRRSTEVATGDVRGVVYEPGGSLPVFNAYLALYVDGELAGVERSDPEGRFDFGTVRAGLAVIEGFDGETGLAGVHVTFQVQPDQVNEVSLVLQDERGAVEGHVYRRTAQGTVPVAGAVVWAAGTPFNTVTDAQGFYRLDGVFAGERSIEAADLATQELVRGSVTVTDGGTSFRDLVFIEEFGDGGIVGEVLGFTGNPVPGALIHLGNSDDQRWWREVVTDTRGRFTLPDLRPGTYMVNAISGAIGVRQAVTIQYEGQTPFVSLRFKKGTIRGRTVIENGLQVTGVTSLVTYRTTSVNEGLVGMSWSPTTIETDADGWFEISDVLVGDYVLSVTNAFHGDRTVRGSLDFHGEEDEHLISFQANGSIRGTVYDWDGETPVAGAVVHLRHPSFSDYDLTTDAEGRFAFELVPPGGRFAIDVEREDGALFRRARAWVNFNRPGQELDVALTLPQQGTVSGWVEDAGGLPVPGAVITVREHAYPRRTLVQTADGEGFFSFTNIFAGRISIDAQAPSLGGLGGRTTVQITTEGEEVWSLVALEGTGEITGRVLSPVDGQVVPSAQVTLYLWAGGVVDTVTADDNGAFRFRLLPLGLYRIWVFDPRTGRHGAMDAVPVDFHGQVSGGDVTLEVRGEVEGHLYDPGTGATIPGATIQLRTDSLVDFTTFSSADADGYYEFLGIPEGTFVLRTQEPEGRRKASASGVISDEGERVTVDLQLEATGRVVGTVLNPPGAPAGAFPNANTVIRENGRVVGATFDNPFVFDGLIVGRRLTLEAYEVGGDHRGTATGTLSAEGEEITVDVTMQPIGTVVVVVTDSFGAPVPGAELALTSTGFYGRRRLVGSTGPDGRATFEEVGVGHVGGYVVNPVNSLRGSAAGQLTLEGQQLEIAFQLENAGRLRGRLLQADATTPAEDALVVVTVAGRTYQLRADANGDFEFPSLPLGSYTVLGQEYFGDGYIDRRGSLTANGQLVDLGTLVLDDFDPEVTSHVPLSGSRDLPLASSVVVHFSEPLDRTRYSSSWFRFRKLSGGNVAYTVAWSDGDTTATLTPNGALANFTGYEVLVQDAYDLAGRRLKERIKTVFYTADQVPPTVIDVLPRNGQVQVAVDAGLRLTFSEPVVLESLSGSAIQLTHLGTGQGVTTTFQLLPGERQALVTPVPGLVTDATYQLTVLGVRDGSGNAMATPVSTSFKTVDTLPPTIDGVDFPAGTTFTSGDEVPVTVTASDPSGVGRVTVEVAEWTFTDSSEPWSLALTAPVVAQEDVAVLNVRVADRFGNLAETQRSITVTPHTNATAPSVETICGLEDHVVVPGVDAELAFRATDDERVERLRVLVDGAVVASVGPVLSPSGDLTALWRPPLGAQPDTTYTVRFEARDFAGNVTSTERNAKVSAGTVLIGARSLFDVYQGQDLVLAGGAFPIREPLEVRSLTLLKGASATNGLVTETFDVRASAVVLQCGSSLTVVQGTPSLAIEATERLVIEERAEIDVSGKGFGGSVDGRAPAGITASTREDAAGSHGGRGRNNPYGGSGTAGDVYGSVAYPMLPGASAAGHYYGTYPQYAERGGGAVHLQVGRLELAGRILANSETAANASGAGGSILIETGILQGGGSIEASGGNQVTAGGGGRVAIHAALLDGFEPAEQVRVLGGTYRDDYPSAAAGTLYVRLPEDEYGRLRIDQKRNAAKHVGSTELPFLGTGSVVGWSPSGGGVWISGAEPFRSRWRGAWIRLLDSAQVEIGSYRVETIDSDGRLWIEAPDVPVVPTSYQGEYRFDQVVVAGGAGLATQDPVQTPLLKLDDADRVIGPVIVAELEILPGTDPVALDPGLTAENLTLRPGAVLTGPSGVLHLRVPGILSVEAGAAIDVSALGYGGAVAGLAPAWVAGAKTENGGGGHGSRGLANLYDHGGAGGDVYDSVYHPALPGGSGAGYWYGSYPNYGGRGGGVVQLEVGDLRLGGEIRARGADSAYGAGAGGTVLLEVESISGGGLIDASGGATVSYGGGSGGRVSLDLGSGPSAFDVLSQVIARGGDGGHDRLAGAGTIYWTVPGDTYGRLKVDGGADRSFKIAATELPGLGQGTVLAVQADGSDAWVEGEVPFPPRWIGAWMDLIDPEGSVLGTFRATELDSAGRLRLSEAASASGAVAFRGEYRFDWLGIRGGASLTSTDRVKVETLDLEEAGSVTVPLEVDTLAIGPGAAPTQLGELIAQSLTVRTGAVVSAPADSSGLLRLVVPGTLTIEPGARLDVSGQGYGGSVSGLAPPGIDAAMTESGGGGHGGAGDENRYRYGGSGGKVFDSVYLPSQRGGSGAGYWYGSYPNYGSWGGGVIDLTVGELVLDGEILALGRDSSHGAGAGGSVLIRATRLRGAGRVDASGGSSSSTAGGGGGRVAVYVQEPTTLSPASQLRAYGGGSSHGRKAAPGTVFIHLPGSEDGVLLLDPGAAAGSPGPTQLPALQEGTVLASEVVDSDAWIASDPGFQSCWVGAWVELLDSAASSLGTFRALDLDFNGRLRLEGAGAAASGAVTYRGEYRFDAVEIEGPARLDVSSKVVVDRVDLRGGGALSGPIQAVEMEVFASSEASALSDVTATNLVLRTGAVVGPHPSADGRIRLKVPGTLTIESGARIEASGHGFGGTTIAGVAPPGVQAARIDGGGGSHGGVGRPAIYSGGGAPGEVYGNVYQPHLPGGSGAGSSGSGLGERGGGVVDLEVGELILDGEISVRGGSCDYGGGAGGSIWIRGGTIQGSGRIDASGGDKNPTDCGSSSGWGSGGGGRVALHIDFSGGFDWTSQVQAWGGTARYSRRAGAGTILWRRAEELFGVLRVDGGGASGITVEPTGLPAIGRGRIGAMEHDFDDPALVWFEDEDEKLFGLGVEGAGVQIGAHRFEILAQSQDRRRLLVRDEEGVLEAGEDYVGVYSFDEVQIVGQAHLSLGDGLHVLGATLTDSGSTLEHLDLDAPGVAVTSPVANASFTAGEDVPIVADVVDDSTISSVVFRLGELSATLVAGPWTAVLPAPVVDEEQDVEIRFEATDAEGNVGTAVLVIRVQPLVLGDPPIVTLLAPSPGALLAPGSSLALTVAASHDDGIEKVEFLAGSDAPVQATLTAPPYTFRVVMPPEAIEGEVVPFRVRARSFNGNTAEVSYPVRVIGAQVVSTDTLIAAADLSLDGTSVVVEAGTLTVEGPHTFRDLVVLEGGAVTHPAATSADQEALELTVTRDLFVESGAAIDASGRGWPGGFDLPETEGDPRLFADDFSGDLSQWQKHDYGSYEGPSNWRIDAADFLRQDSNIHIPVSNPGTVGTHLYWTGGMELEDYWVSALVRSQDDDWLGILFRYQDPDNYYRFMWTLSGNVKVLDKRENGIKTVLAQASGAYTRYAWHRVEVLADGPEMEVFVDGQRVLAARDETFSQGSIGFSLNGNAGSYFDDLVVRAVPSTSPATGGSHGGRGGGFDGSGRIYGTPFDPWDAGAGGGGGFGGAGGGVIRLVAGGAVVVDGEVTAAADPAVGSAPFGAGGSILVQATSILGAGSIDASGGGDGTSRKAGGGGRIALYAATVDEGLLARTTAAGGAASTAERTGGAGTIFVQRGGQGLGDLVLDNLGRTTEQWTELLAAAPSTVEVVEPAGFTDTTARFPYSLVGAEVALEGDLSTLWRIVDHADGGDRLDLDTATPWTAVPGDQYEIVYRFDRVAVRGGAKLITKGTLASGSAPEVEAGSALESAYQPSLTFSVPAPATEVVSGDSVTFEVVPSDLFGIARVVLEFNGETQVDESPPYQWTMHTPLVVAPVELVATARAWDLSGNALEASVPIVVVTNPDGNAPQVTLASCPVDNDWVASGAPIGLGYDLSDLEELYSWHVRVNGVTVDEGFVNDVTSVTGTVNWAPPADPPGTVYLVEVEARDYGGNATVAQRAVRLTAGLVLVGDQTLNPASLAGTDLVLAGGSFTMSGDLDLSSLRLVSQARVVSGPLQPLRIQVDGELTVQCGTSLDVTGRGYLGAVSYNSAGGAPAGVTGSRRDAGGSHGGSGRTWEHPGPAGDVYDSVYEPSQGGGGGTVRASTTSYRAGNGGGVVDLEVATLVLDGTIQARGESRLTSGYHEATGAGGTVRIDAGTVTGAGTIDASGGDFRPFTYKAGVGGGGRVALHVDSFVGFDPATQVVVRGGLRRNADLSLSAAAAPGTLYVMQSGMTYGVLRIDPGAEHSASDAGLPLTTELPALGEGAVALLEDAGADAWLTGDASFSAKWAGAWVVLLDAGGIAMGSYRVSELDGAGRLRLADAAGAAGAMRYRGEYRFDRVELVNGAGLLVHDPLQAPEVVTDGSGIEGPVATTILEVLPGLVPTALSEGVLADSLTVRSGATVTSPSSQSGRLALSFPGTLTIEAGASLDVTARGYLGAVSYNSAGGAPAGVTGSRRDAGGSHGGSGRTWEYAGPAGEVYDSVYEPSQGGGGGTVRVSTTSYRAGNGGGVVDLEVGTLVLEGTIQARGESRLTSGYHEATGAGGTVRIHAGTVSGAGTIDVSGGDFRPFTYKAGVGGGGRAALHVDSFVGFDPATQVVVRGGLRRNADLSLSAAAAPGTLYVMQSGMTHGVLRIDPGAEHSASDAGLPLTTELPALGEGAVALLEDAGADAWLTGDASFSAKWAGAWVVLLDGGGSALGSFQAPDLDGAGRLRLAGAAGVTGAMSYRGEYRFDRVELVNGAGLLVHDPLQAPEVVTNGSGIEGAVATTILEVLPGRVATALSEGVVAESLTVRSGATVTASASQSGRLALRFPGTLTIEAGASLDVTGRGYPGVNSYNSFGGAPAGVVGSFRDAGGSHGGSGRGWDYVGPPGEVFDSVYEPSMGGGGGTVRTSSTSYRGGNGGGVVDLELGTLVLEGTIQARGESRLTSHNEATGAGGTVRIHAGTVTGSGSIDASGGDFRYFTYRAGVGGGGRVALFVDSFVGFDPTSQVNVRGGLRRNSNLTLSAAAAPGTLYVMQPGMTHGELRVDPGPERTADSAAWPLPTALPTVGVGAIGVAEADPTALADLWIEPQDPAAQFSLGIEGLWLRVDGDDFRILEQASRRRVRLEGAAGLVSVNDAYQGVYKFDVVTVRNGAVLQFLDTAEIQTTDVDADSQVLVP